MRRAFIAAVLLVGVALFAAAPASAVVSQVRGKVVGPDGEPVPDAQVVLEFLGGVPRKFELKTNKKGEYLQVGLDSGPYRITATKEGFRGASVEIRAALGDATDVPDLQLMTAEALADQPGSAEAELRAKFQAASEALEAGKYEEAEAGFKALAEQYPDIPQIHQNLGLLYARQKMWPEAEASLLKARELSPDDSQIATALAGGYQESGQKDKAVALMNETASANPSDAKAQFNKGIFLLNSNKPEEALASFQAAIAADPSMAEAHFRAGTLLIGMGKVPEAIEELEAYVAANPANAENLKTAQGLLQALKK